MINVSDKSQCCGCWACENICPKKCITMKEDHEGFRYPEIDEDSCINCGLCERVCPIKLPKQNDDVPLSYVVQHKNSNILRTSTSGGFFTSIAKYAIEKGGVVFGATFDVNMELRHSYSDTLEGCKKFRGSKYVQSLIGDTYKQAKSFLDSGRMVVFSGTPCQIAGLYGFLKERIYENLITVDLVCHGVPSPLLFRKYISFYEKKGKSKIINYLSRDKYYGYDYSTATIFFDNKKKQYHKGMEADIMLRLYFKNICSRPSCYNCHFKTLNRVSDFTIFDCWNAQSVSKKFSRNGATNVFIHTPKGQLVFDKIKEDFLFATSQINYIIEHDGLMIKHFVPVNSERDEFFNDLNKQDIKYIENKYLNNSNLKKICAFLKPFLYRIGIFKMYMMYKNRCIK